MGIVKCAKRIVFVDQFIICNIMEHNSNKLLPCLKLPPFPAHKYNNIWALVYCAVFVSLLLSFGVFRIAHPGLMAAIVIGLLLLLLLLFISFYSIFRGMTGLRMLDFFFYDYYLLCLQLLLLLSSFGWNILVASTHCHPNNNKINIPTAIFSVIIHHKNY